MALTRKLLKGMGLTEEQVDTVIEAHAETVDGLKSDIAKYKADVEQLPTLQRELEEAKQAAETAGKDPWQEKYNAIKTEYEDYKGQQEAEKLQKAKEQAYSALLKEIGITESRLGAVLRVSDLEKMELDEKGALKDVDALKKAAKKEWADFIPTTQVQGASTATPPKTEPTAKDPFEQGFDGE